MNRDFKEQSRQQERKLKRKLLTNIKEATPVDTGRARNGWRLIANNIINEVPYVDDLNNGTSTREPLFFIERAVLNTRGIKVRGQIVKTK